MIFGNKAGFEASVNPNTLDGTNGFVVKGGSSASAAGDVNGDGIDDVIIASVQVYVMYGNDQGFAASIDPADFDGSNGFVIDGTVGFESVSGAGDMNGDGIDDVVIGSPTGAGRSYIVFGRDGGGGARFDLASLDGTNGFVVNGRALGTSVSGAGDVNGDGLSDVILGSDGGSYVVFGTDRGIAASLDVIDLDGSNGFVINPVRAEDRHSVVSGAGDLNGDGLGDVIIGAAITSPDRQSPHESYVVFGNDQGFGASLDLTSLDDSTGLILSADRAVGYSVSGAGDVNGDGVDDVIVGAVRVDNVDELRPSYVVFGKKAVSDTSDGSQTPVIPLPFELGTMVTVSQGYKVRALKNQDYGIRLFRKTGKAI